MHLLQSSPVRKVATLLMLTHPSNFFLFLRQRRDFDSLFKFPTLLKYEAKRLEELVQCTYLSCWGCDFMVVSYVWLFGIVVENVLLLWTVKMKRF